MRKHNKVFNTLPLPETGDQLGFGDDLIEAFYKLTPDEREIVMSIVDRLKPGLTAYDFEGFRSLRALAELDHDDREEDDFAP